MGPITARVNKTTMASMGRQPCGRPLMKKKIIEIMIKRKELLFCK